MSFIELAKKRYSVRTYKNKPIEEEKLQEILEAAKIAPTAANKQPQRILVLKNKEGLEKLSNGAKTFGAPLAFVICGDSSQVWIRPQDGKKTIDIDTSIVTDHMMHRATELGLGTLWMTWFDPEVLKNEFNIPEGIEPVNILLAGYSDGDVKSPERHSVERKDITETVIYDSF